MTFWSDEQEALRETARAFVRSDVVPQLQQWEDAGEVPRELHARAAKLGLLRRPPPALQDPISRESQACAQIEEPGHHEGAGSLQEELGQRRRGPEQRGGGEGQRNAGPEMRV